MARPLISVASLNSVRRASLLFSGSASMRSNRASLGSRTKWTNRKRRRVNQRPCHSKSHCRLQ